MGLSTTTTQFSPFRPFCHTTSSSSSSSSSSLKFLHPCPCFSSSSSRSLFSNTLHRFWAEPTGIIVNLEGRGEKRILTSRNYSTASSLETAPTIYRNTRNSWIKETKNLREQKRIQKSNYLRDCKTGNAQGKNEISGDGCCFPVLHRAVGNQKHIPFYDKSGNQKQTPSRNCGHFKIRNARVKDEIAEDGTLYTVNRNAQIKDEIAEDGSLYTANGNAQVKNEIAEDGSLYTVNGNAQVKNEIAEDGNCYTVVQETKVGIKKLVPVYDKSSNQKQALSTYGGRGNLIPDNVNGQTIENKMPDSLSFNNISRTSAWDFSVGYMNNQEVDRKTPNVFSLPENLKLDIRTDTSLSIKMLEHEKDRNFDKIENEPQPASTVSDAKKSSNTKEASHHPDVKKRLTSIYGKILVVDNVSMADKVVSKLTNEYRHLVHACDTEVAKIEVKQETPVDHGEIICFSIYSGPKADFGNGKSCIWVDVLDGGGNDILVKFKPFFENPEIKKVWHNYSFDKHVIQNYEIPVCGFHADTMHMARLWNSSRRIEGGYSLEALTSDKRVMSGADSCFKELIGKTSMKTIFGKNKLRKDGSEGKMITVAPVEVLQREERKPWICYSALDAISTWQLYQSLKRKLYLMPWILNGELLGKSMLDFYEEYWRPFGELLVRMETEGILVDRAYLAEIERIAKAEQEIAANRFRNWACKYCPDAKYMNVGSDAQLRQLFFGGIANRKDPTDNLPEERTIKVPNVDGVIEEGKKAPTKFRSITLHKIGDFPAEIYTATGWPSVSGDALKTLAGKVSAEYDFMNDNIEDGCEAEPNDNLKAKVSPVTKDVDTSAYGTALNAFPSSLGEGIEACHAIASLCEVCSIDSLISNFILPLQGSNVSGKRGRVHCSLNINTETGRLSARRPNLQNQPALEKDRYKIRQAFIAAPGNSLIVADYGQLELRILAHLADCKSMLEAFKAGGDFHSRTAMNMYPHIHKAVDKGEVLLEWYPQPGEDKPPAPLLKDAFGSERRKAKMLNFSIAYGKTPMGLARDWKVSVEEAKETVNLWYKERQEVRKWQEARKLEAKKDGRVHTLLGRARIFPSLSHASNAQKGHIERAAINTPVQGSAADVAMCAMLQISRNKWLKELGWKLLLQIHDEVILEGPTESAEVAKSIVVECMSKPFFDGVNFLKVDLSVDAKCAQNWYAAK